MSRAQEGLELYQRIRAYQRQADTCGLEYQADPRGLGYAVVDLETTGLEPQDEAIIEVGVVLLDPHGREQLRWAPWSTRTVTRAPPVFTASLLTISPTPLSWAL